VTKTVCSDIFVLTPNQNKYLTRNLLNWLSWDFWAPMQSLDAPMRYIATLHKSSQTDVFFKQNSSISLIFKLNGANVGKYDFLFYILRVIFGVV
jgi:hypothetical protein